MSPHRTPPPGERVFLWLLAAFCGFMLWQAFRISGFSSITSAGVYPMLAALTMLVSVIVVLVQSRRSPAPEVEPAAAAPGAGSAAPGGFMGHVLPGVVVQFALAITLYMAALERLGFLLSSFLFLAGSMRLLGSRRWSVNLGVSALSLAAIYLVFQTVFSVVLPRGTWLRPLFG